MSIKLFAICVTTILCVGYVAGDYCYNDVVGACSPVGGEVQNCNSRYGAFKGDELLVNVQGYANTHILRSFQFLLMSSHFGNFEKNRGGFEKLYRQLSDNTWEQAIDLVKFIGKRGGHMNFRARKTRRMKNKLILKCMSWEAWQELWICKKVWLKKHISFMLKSLAERNMIQRLHHIWRITSYINILRSSENWLVTPTI
ncbi:uncharacterized protein LOC100166657 precursor [Acyrthosiphon pisum]|uniref:ACYPI007511 protein n=1 Tax=Acyrthosiphon pisum TaxID=7029 RepID=C4WT92_ACYPI|nr:uncharacterized protein LOC100166657 precursor [Acyrthosiphon pisum]BAH71112.1 ACYPI007511 [Acyrthosiphon pisum]|eukprot:NP_001280254.1 uncharacterized LOC100166657 precursor [Acyrthosiphon pisum]